MDIVTRIKSFLNNQGLAVSQFADSCDIPRPTVSQLLNGRNKKVSDEIISKIHVAYPNLSIMWLMFGEEPMLLGSEVVGNSKMSENNILSFDLFGENNENLDIDATEFKNQNLRSSNITDSIDISAVTSVKSEYSNQSPARNEQVASDIRKIISDPVAIKSEIKSQKTGKEIVNIMVFYSDNSFESFKPNSR